MPTNFNPVYTISPRIAKHLMRIEAAKQKVFLLPVNSRVLASLQAIKLVSYLVFSLVPTQHFVKNGWKSVF